MEANQNRLTILTQSEIQDYFGIPRFTQDDREYYFDILSDEKSLIPKNWPIHSKVNFILQLGYFKAKRMFFNFEMSEAEDDVAYIFDTYFPYEASIQIKPLSKPTRLKHQLTISRHYQYKKFEPKIATDFRAGETGCQTICKTCVYITGAAWISGKTPNYPACV